MAIVGKTRCLRSGEEAECHYCETRATHSVESGTGKTVNVCKDHLEDLQDGTIKLVATIQSEVFRAPPVKNDLKDQIKLF